MNRKAVQKAEREFNSANDELRDFEIGGTEIECPHCKKTMEIDNEDILAEYRSLAATREAARDRAIAVARENGAPICGMQPVSAADRAYDVETLWDLLEDKPELRAMVVKTKYSVSTPAFDEAVRTGGITPDIREKVLIRDGIKFTMRNQPNSIKL